MRIRCRELSNFRNLAEMPSVIQGGSRSRRCHPWSLRMIQLEYIPGDRSPTKAAAPKAATERDNAASYQSGRPVVGDLGIAGCSFRVCASYLAMVTAGRKPTFTQRSDRNYLLDRGGGGGRAYSLAASAMSVTMSGLSSRSVLK